MIGVSLMIKPRIYLSIIDDQYYYESPAPPYEQGVRAWVDWVRATGKGGTPKEAFTDWYIKQIGAD